MDKINKDLDIQDVIDTYFQFQKNNIYGKISGDMTTEELEILSGIYGFEVVRGMRVYKFLLCDSVGCETRYFTNSITKQLIDALNKYTYISENYGVPIIE